jgi:hypothetical protein
VAEEFNHYSFQDNTQLACRTAGRTPPPAFDTDSLDSE